MPAHGINGAGGGGGDERGGERAEAAGETKDEKRDKKREGVIPVQVMVWIRPTRVDVVVQTPVLVIMIIKVDQ